MSRAGDYGGEMDTPREMDDATAEALLAGRSVATDLEPLVRVVAAYREITRRPVPPRGELATRMATGDFRRADTHCQAPRHRLAAPRWRRSAMLGRLAVRLAGVSLAAKAGAGVAIALASVGTAGAAGFLPGTVQDRFDTVVETVSGPDPPSPTPALTPALPPALDNLDFGQDVSEDAQDGGVDGGQTSERAREQGEEHRSDQPPTPGPGESAAPAGPPPERGRPADPGKPTDLPHPPGKGRPGPPSHPAPQHQ